MRSALGFSMRRSCRRSGCPGTLSTSIISPGRAPGTKIGSAVPSTTPSPRWPSRSITSRSTTLGLDEEFSVAIAAENRRGHEAADTPAQQSQNHSYVITDRGVDRRVTHNALFADTAPGLELRFDQCDERGAHIEQFTDCRQYKFQRDEANVHCRQIRLCHQAGGIEGANVGLLDGGNFRAAA